MSKTLVIPGTGAALAGYPGAQCQPRREALAGAVDPETATGKFVASTQEGGWCRFPAKPDTDDGASPMVCSPRGDGLILRSNDLRICFVFE